MHKYWPVSDRVSVLQIHLSKEENKDIYNIKNKTQTFPNSIKLKIVKTENSNENSNEKSNYKCLPIP